MDEELIELVKLLAKHALIHCSCNDYEDMGISCESCCEMRASLDRMKEE